MTRARLRPSELCLLLNSTPLGEVINEGQLRRLRSRAGLRIGDARHVDLVRFVAWLVQALHAPKRESANLALPGPELAEAAQGAAALGSRWEQVRGHGQKLTQKQEALIAALLTEPTYAAAATKAGVGETTLYRWLQLRSFRKAYRQARRELVEAAIGRIQAATGIAVETLLVVARQGRRDSDRVRAANSLLDHAFQGLSNADLLHGDRETDEGDSTALGTADLVRILSAQLRRVDGADLPTAEKSRLTTMLPAALLRAIEVDVLDKRLEALEAVLRWEEGPREMNTSVLDRNYGTLTPEERFRLILAARGRGDENEGTGWPGPAVASHSPCRIIRPMRMLSANLAFLTFIELVEDAVRYHEACLRVGAADFADERRRRRNRLTPKWKTRQPYRRSWTRPREDSP